MTARTKRIVIDYTPRQEFRDFHARKERYAVMVCHRRAGKTVATINDLLSRAVQTRKKDARFAYVAPLYNQAKDVAWTYLKHYAAPLLAEPPNESELRVDLVNGSRIRLYGADNPDRLRGIYLDGVVLDEYADMRHSVWSEVVRPMLVDRNGWAVFIGTPRGKNAFWEVWHAADDKWYRLLLKASDTGLIPQQELIDAAADMGRDHYAQEFECSFEAAIKGAFYADELERMKDEGRISRLPIEHAVKVYTAWDLGVSDSTAIWFIQCVGKERRLIDYYEGSGVGLDHYAKVLKDKGYLYAEHYFPHDVEVREMTTGTGRADTLRGLGIEVETVKVGDVLDGINAVRRMLDSVWIDPHRCDRGLEALKAYRRDWDDKLKTWKLKPRHDWSSHAADALRTFATGFEGVRKPLAKSAPKWFSRKEGSSWLGA